MVGFLALAVTTVELTQTTKETPRSGPADDDAQGRSPKSDVQNIEKGVRNPGFEPGSLAIPRGDGKREF